MFPHPPASYRPAIFFPQSQMVTRNPKQMELPIADIAKATGLLEEEICVQIANRDGF